MNKKLTKFLNEFNNEFHETGARRTAAEVFARALLDVPIQLYALNMNNSAIIDLHGIIEKFAKGEVAFHLSSTKNQEQIMMLLERKNLPEFTEILKDVGLLSKNDVKYAQKLYRLRSGLAHRNEKVVSNIVNSGKKISHLDIDSIMYKQDILPEILRGIQLLIDLLGIREKSNRSSD